MRTPIKIQRAAISILSDMGYKKFGGYMLFKKPSENPPIIKTASDEKVLWCPYCGEWAVFKRREDERSVSDCLGPCGWVNTKDFYVRTANNLWWD